MAEEKKASADNDMILAAVSTINIVGLIIYFAMPDASAYVKNYARQGATLLLFVIIMWIPVVNCIALIIYLVAWILLLINALQKKPDYKLPVLGDLAYSIFK